MKVLIVDDDIDFRGLAATLLRKRFPQVQISEYDPEVLGMPRSSFPWADFDVVLLDHELRSEQSGLDWLRHYAGIAGAPAVIFTTGSSDANVAAQAIKLGATDYLSKRGLAAEQLAEVVNSAMTSRVEDLAARAGREMRAPEAPVADAMDHAGLMLRRILGCGGTSDVYLAERENDGHTVVVKILRVGMMDQLRARERFRAEAALLHRLQCPQVVRVYEHGVESGRPYMVMEYLGHGDLAARVTAGGLGLGTSLRYLKSILQGLTAIHAHDVVHRDLKPANVMFRYDDSIALTDFGISRHGDDELGFTSTGSIVGTPSYISPEQAEGQGADARSDLYSAGVLFYELLTGSRPYTASTAAGLFMQHAVASIPRLPGPLAAAQDLLEGLMAKDPARRTVSAGEALNLLNELAAAEGVETE